MHSGGGEEGEGKTFFGSGGDDSGMGGECVMRLNDDSWQGLAQAVHDGMVARSAAPGDETVSTAREETVQGVGDAAYCQLGGSGELVRA